MLRHLATGPYQSKPTTGVYNAAGELIDVIDTPAGETRRSIAADGEDFKTSGDFAFEDSGHTDTWGINGRIEYDLNDSTRLINLIPTLWSTRAWVGAAKTIIGRWDLK